MGISAFNFPLQSCAAPEYTYDANGNLTRDSHKKIAKIQYNLLNLPSALQFTEGHTSEYLYDAAGVKRKVKQVTTTENLLVPMGSMLPVPADKVAVTTQTDYCGNVIYENGTLSRILVDGGYITMNGTAPTYHYYIQDHQGNNRVVFNQNGTIEQTNHYYPFGMTFGEGIDNSDNRYKYNGKELDRMHGLDWYDYGARMQTGMNFTTPDPLAEKYYSISPYAYCANNPIRFIDPNGKDIVIAGDLSYRTATFNNLQQLSDRKLILLKNGEVVNSSSFKGDKSQILLKGTPSGKGKNYGTALLNGVINNKHTVTIKNGKDDEFNANSDKNSKIEGLGSGGTLSFENSENGIKRSGIINTDCTDYSSDQSILGHELIHAIHSFFGIVDDTEVSVKDPDNPINEVLTKEEIKTREHENLIRKEQGDKLRALPR